MFSINDPATETTDGALDYEIAFGQERFSYSGSPATLTHPYLRTGIDQNIRLASTDFWLQEPEKGPLTGCVDFIWRPNVSIQASGARETRISDIDSLLEESESIWIAHPNIKLADPLTLPKTDEEYTLDGINKDAGYRILGQNIQRVEVGKGNSVHEVRFLVPNGWKSTDGFRTRPFDVSTTPTRGRSEIIHEDWRIRLDRASHVDRNYMKLLHSSHGYGITHIGRITKLDGREFAANECLPMLENLNMALTLMMGRHVGAILPVGYSNGSPIWAKWDHGRVDQANSISTFREESIASRQFMELGTKVLELCRDPLKRDVLRLTLGYLVQASGKMDMELSVGAYLTGIYLLCHSRLVVELGTISGNSFRQSKTDVLMRHLLKDAQIDMEIPEHFQNLKLVSEEFESRDGQKRDGPGCITKMRNEVMHPTRDRLTNWSGKQWAECGFLASYYLESALLHWIGYEGRYSFRLAKSRWTGQTELVPWADHPSTIQAGE